MQRLLVNSSLVRSADVQRDVEGAAQAVKAKQAQHKSKGVAKKRKYWLEWGDAERRVCVDIYVKLDVKGIQLHYVTLHCPNSQSVPEQRRLRKGLQSPIPVGRPSFERAEEKPEVRKYFDGVRNKGVSVDCETMTVLADTVACCSACGSPCCPACCFACCNAACKAWCKTCCPSVLAACNLALFVPCSAGFH